MDILTTLYMATGFIGAAAFIPQIVTLLKDRSGAVAINLNTYLIFTATTAISFLYAWLINGDTYFMLVSGAFMFGNAIVFTLALRRRLELRTACVKTQPQS